MECGRLVISKQLKPKKKTYRVPVGHAATDSRRPRPKTENGTFEIVTTECRRPDGAGACDNVAKNSASFDLNKINE